MLDSIEYFFSLLECYQLHGLGNTCISDANECISFGTGSCTGIGITCIAVAVAKAAGLRNVRGSLRISSLTLLFPLLLLCFNLSLDLSLPVLVIVFKFSFFFLFLFLLA